MDIIEFHKSTAKELLALKNRVRNLIQHWGEDGRHHEVILKTMIERFLPEKYRIGTGFVVQPTHERGDHQASKQIDLIIYDTAYPVLFKENDFVILTADAVVGIIEVKADLLNQNYGNVVRICNENGKFINKAFVGKPHLIFNGIFSFESSVHNIDVIAERILDARDNLNDIEWNKYCVNHISFNDSYFYKLWNLDLSNAYNPNCIYEISELSFSFFISNLIAFITHRSVEENDNLWFPVDKSIQMVKRF
ncbi:DUF6602 domain-containing protein [Fluviicola sp.]|uniref:DUF6602 domain-containing protein n=1 Tax=Fluviicola sp. TaxID=1917219 RepID=UPI00261BAEA6|nr:DUF6602 domain-containing protein [Fluviicola sp.]